ncbi:MAG: AMP-binding protein [Akkermansiaceae bacterium]
MPANPQKSDLAERLGHMIEKPDPGRFNELALALFAFQFTSNSPYQRFARHLDRTPENVTRWQEIPAVPTSAFKLPDIPLTCGLPTSTTFLTSGTTAETKGAHHFPDTHRYELSIQNGWPFSDELPPFFLAPPPSEAPHSSLTHMFACLNSGDSSRFLLRNSRFHLAPLYEYLRSSEPIFLMGTALAFLHLMETIGPIALPAGSQLLETGGYKGTSRTLAKPDFYQQLAAFFDLPLDQLHNEYGMTELSSQAYATGPNGNHRFPPWCRHLILNPETQQPAREGQPGYLVLHDLANLHSVAAIQTQDFAIAQPDGSFTLLGRDPSALPRGCSRTIDQALSR